MMNETNTATTTGAAATVNCDCGATATATVCGEKMCDACAHDYHREQQFYFEIGQPLAADLAEVA